MDICGTLQNKKNIVAMLMTKPYKLGHLVGFTKLNDLNNDWIVSMIRGTNDETLQAHRG